MDKKQFSELMQSISKSVGDNTDVMEQLRTAQTAFEEAVDNSAKTSQTNDWEEKYNNLKEEYRRRFFEPTGQPQTDPVQEQEDTGPTLDDILKTEVKR